MQLLLLEEALSRSEALRTKFPNLPVCASIIAQLHYLCDLEAGKTNDRSRLKDIVLGVQAAREIEALDPKLADMLHEISATLGKTRKP